MFVASLVRKQPAKFPILSPRRQFWFFFFVCKVKFQRGNEMGKAASSWNYQRSLCKFHQRDERRPASIDFEIVVNFLDFVFETRAHEFIGSLV